ncbi:hypothetical protein M422DRAFT_40890 [Sphaerobolus stellatus SS14]|nr:hypothetical protein M422DRAFT_40890 [Sphaerobolus stellatus SS14]
MDLNNINNHEIERQVLDTLCQIEVGYKSTLNRATNGVTDGTRVELINEIRAWAASPDLSKRIYILSGGAGTGKSTIAYTVAEKLEESNLLGASFFFAKDSKDVSDTKHFVSAIARQLAFKHPHLQPKIVEAIRRRPASSALTLSDEFQQLIVEPLSDLPPSFIPLVFVIDALDECLDPSSSNQLFRILVTELKDQPLPLKVFLTGRPNSHATFTQCSDCILHDLDQEKVNIDITTYLEDRFRDISTTEVVVQCTSNWYTSQDIDTLTKLCHGLFIYASTSTLYIKNRLDFSKPEDSLRKILMQRDEVGGPQGSLDCLYQDVLGELFGPNISLTEQERHEILQHRIHPTIAFIAQLLQPLSVPSLAQLLKHVEGSHIKEGDDIRLALKRLAAVIFLPHDDESTIRMHHASFPEFLTNLTRCATRTMAQPWYFVDSDKSESDIACACLDIIITELHQNIINIPDPSLLNSEVQHLDDLIKQYIPSHTQYACLYGLSHVLAVKSPSGKLLERLTAFVNSKLLEYIEVLSLLGRTEIAIVALTQMNAWLKVSRLPYSL